MSRMSSPFLPNGTSKQKRATMAMANLLLFGVCRGDSSSQLVDIGATPTDEPDLSAGVGEAQGQTTACTETVSM